MASATGTCTPWAGLADLCSPCDDYSLDAALMEDALQIASDVLFDLTGRRWPGECNEVIRPCRRGCAEPGGCGCGGASEFTLPGYPATEIIEILVNGDVVDPGEYRLDGQVLVGLELPDGTRRTWPHCQRLDRATTEDCTWSIEYSYGNGPPPGGIRYAGVLACELYKSCQPESFTGASACRLPKRVTSITRQGVTLAILDPLTIFTRDALTGLVEVDLWITSVRQGDARRRATVRDPAAPRRVRRPGA